MPKAVDLYFSIVNRDLLRTVDNSRCSVYDICTMTENRFIRLAFDLHITV